MELLILYKFFDKPYNGDSFIQPSVVIKLSREWNLHSCWCIHMAVLVRFSGQLSTREQAHSAFVLAISAFEPSGRPSAIYLILT